MTDSHAWILDAAVQGGSVPALRAAAAALEDAGDLARAAAALDQAHMLAPDDGELAAWRARVLDGLALTMHGLSLRYLPAGAFWMGAEDGDPDERPVHARHAGDIWVGEVPVTWTAFCRLLGWTPPPEGEPQESDEMGENERFELGHQNTLRQLYSVKERGSGPRHLRVSPPDDFDAKPMVAVTIDEAEALAAALSGGGWRFRLPTEAEWEKAARGGLVGKRYAWGDAPPTPAVCCCGVFSSFAMTPTADLAPNGYGLRAMCGSVWELTADSYDALAYHNGGRIGPGAEARVVRGGSWADSPAAVTVSFRVAHKVGRWGFPTTPTIGFRLCAERIG